MLFSFVSVLPIPKVYAVFTYGNWNWDSGNRLLTIIANATNNEGNTEANAYGFQDIVDSGLVSTSYYNVSQSGTQFEFSFRIVLGDGVSGNTTWFVDSDKQVTFVDEIVSASWQKLIEVKGYGNLRFGILDDATSKTTHGGCHIISLENSYHLYFIYGNPNSDVNIYSSIFANPYYGQANIQFRDDGRLWNSILSESSLSPVLSGTMDYFNVIIEKGGATASAMEIYSSSATFDKIVVTDIGRIIYSQQAYTFTVTNLYARSYTYLFAGWRYTANGYLIDADVDSWTFYFYSTNPTGEIYRQYTFDLTVTYPNGTMINGTATGCRVTIQHYGQGGAVDYNATLGEDGTIPAQTLTMGYYNQTGGDTIYSYNPYNLLISNLTGYADYSLNFTLNSKLVWTATYSGRSSAWVLALGFAGLLILVPIGVLFYLRRK